MNRYKGKDISMIVSTVIRDINPLDLLIFYLKIGKGISTKDIRELTGLSQDKLNRRLKRIYNKIREEFDEDLIN